MARKYMELTLRRRDLGDGYSQLLDKFGDVVATVRTSVIDGSTSDGGLSVFGIAVD